MKRMHSLFFKIFGWFWLAVASLLVIVVSLSFLIRTLDQNRNPAPQPDWTALSAGQAASKYENGGVLEFLDHASEVESLTHRRIYLVDEAGRDVGGRELPPGVREFVLAAAREGKSLRRNVNGLDTSLQRVTIKPDRHLTFVTVRPRPRPALVTLPGPESMWLLLAAAILTAGLVCFGLARYLTAPIRELTSATRRLAEGDLEARAGASIGHRQDELADLGRQFNHMATRIESLVTSQRELLRNVSHELRSPLARLNVALGLARRHATGPAVEQLDRIEREAERLNQLIGQLLTLSRLESEDRAIESRPIRLDDLVQSVAEDARFEARARGIDVRVLPGRGETVHGVPELLRSALENVVRNALRFAPDGSPVELNVNGGVNGHTVVSVRDHGPGVPEEELERLFQPFHRLDADQRGGGAGLGLAIVQRAVKLHGGQVAARNAPDGGLIVDIRLPKA